jgi:hypothetical protein
VEKYCLLLGIKNAHSLLMALRGDHAAFDDRGGVLDRGGGVCDRPRKRSWPNTSKAVT